MCGIIAFSDETITDKKTVIEDMMEMIRHRGPNLEGGGHYLNDQVALGFCRLSIIDLQGGGQPIYNEDGSILIIFNGEIYNYQALRKELLAAGHIFKTKADTEVLLHGYEEWGMAGTLKRVRGMFAYLIWDDNKKTLFGARDFFGIKPLYYYDNGATFIVGSEIKAFLKHPNFKKELNKNALKSYLMNQYNDLPETFFKNVYRFPAGHWFERHDQETQIHEYWDAKYDINYERTPEETVKAIDQTIQDSVKMHNIADVPVGSFLSEGVDSSYVTSLLRPKEVFSVNFDNGPYDEASAAKALSDQEGLHFNATTVSGDAAFHDFAEMQYHMDEPDGNPSLIPLWYLCRLARKKVTVALSGEGADELFAGYVNYGMHSHHQLIKVFANGLAKLPTGARAHLARSIKKMPNFPGKTHLYTHTAVPSAFYVGESVIYDPDQPTIFTSAQANRLLQAPYRNDSTVNGVYQQDFKKVANAEAVKQMQYIDLHHFMLNDILQKADKISMAHSLELRVPFLDKKVAELANTIPSDLLLTKNDTKDIFRQAAARHLPEDWATRPKLGFPVPIKTWLREEKYFQQVKAVFSQDWVREFFDRDQILGLLVDNFNGKVDARRQIWTIYTFLVWYQLYFRDFDQTVKDYAHVQPEVQALMASGKLTN
ncbi:asparagine synthase (glutamine-hydrolyzing) [Lapidilactobacillus luobeiensis]|uniref:asparagine synthase (glutamine-hydrolyzing) n=1 Tax=Lapidilactobacillus luobeiensis TaxID=2950371 RepID=UPI0021C27221|nr:asparagine synthase (glutamine-hydrolyzing) [Lapidilactobacillus luobeiensis]